MRRALLIAVVSLGLAACGGPAAPTPVNPKAPTLSQGTLIDQLNGMPVTITTKRTSLGRVLGSGSGTGSPYTIYLFSGDDLGASHCLRPCSIAWVPLSGSPRAAGGVSAAALGTVVRPNGLRQVTYGGRPLYTFYKDQLPGDVSGEGLRQFGGTWDAISSRGDLVQLKGR